MPETLHLNVHKSGSVASPNGTVKEGGGRRQEVERGERKAEKNRAATRYKIKWQTAAAAATAAASANASYNIRVLRVGICRAYGRGSWRPASQQ